MWDDKAAHGGVPLISAEPGLRRDAHQFTLRPSRNGQGLPSAPPCLSSSSDSSCSRASKPWRNHPGEMARQSQRLQGASTNVSARNNDFYRPEKPPLGDAPFPAPARAASRAHAAGDDAKLVCHTGKALVSSSPCDSRVSHPPLQRCRGVGGKRR